MDVCLDQTSPEQLVSDALHQLVQSIHHRAGFLNIYQSVIECVEPDIRYVYTRVLFTDIRIGSLNI